jgi:hypothetical protein
MVRGYPALLSLSASSIVAIANREWPVAAAALYASQVRNVANVGTGRAALLPGIWGPVDITDPPQSHRPSRYPFLSYRLSEVMKIKLASYVDDPDLLDELTTTVELLIILVQLYEKEKPNFVPGYMVEAASRGDDRHLPRASRMILGGAGASGIVAGLLGAGFLEGREATIESVVAKHEAFRKTNSDWIQGLGF